MSEKNMDDSELLRLAEASHENWRKKPENAGSKFNIPFAKLPDKMRQDIIDSTRNIVENMKPPSEEAPEPEPEPAPQPAPRRRPLTTQAAVPVEEPQPAPQPQPQLRYAPPQQYNPVVELAGAAFQLAGNNVDAAIGLLAKAQVVLMRGG